MRPRREMKVNSELLIKSFAGLEIDITLVKYICALVNSMNDSHIVGVAVDTLLDIGEALKPNADKEKFMNSINSRYFAVAHSMGLSDRYGMYSESALKTRFEKITSIKTAMEPLVNLIFEKLKQNQPNSLLGVVA